MSNNRVNINTHHQYLVSTDIMSREKRGTIKVAILFFLFHEGYGNLSEEFPKRLVVREF